MSDTKNKRSSPQPQLCFEFVDQSSTGEIPFCITLLDKAMTVLAVNNHLSTFYAGKPEDIVGHNCFKLRSEAEGRADEATEPCADCVTYEALESGKNLSRTVERRGAYYHVTALPIVNPAGERMVLEIAEEASGLVRADLHLRRQCRALSLITEISRRFNKSDDLKAKLEWLLEKLIGEFGFDSGEIYLVRGKGDALKLVCHAGLSEGFVTEISEPPASGHVMDRLRQGEVVHTDDYSEHVLGDGGGLAEAAERLGTVVAIPLMFEDSLQGVINLAVHNTIPMSDVELDLMGEISRGAGAVVANARLADEVIAGAEQFRVIVENSTVGIMGFDHQGRIILWNEACENIYGWKVEDILGNRVHDTVANLASEENTNAIIDDVFKGKRLPFTEGEDMSADGCRRYTLASKFPLLSSGGDVLMGISTIVDITEQKQGQKKINELARIIENTSEAVVVTDLDFRIKFINDAARNLYGYTQEELTGRYSWELTARGKPTVPPEEVKRMLARGGKYDGEAEQRRKDGSTFWGMRRIEALWSEGGEFAGFVRYTTDITAQRNAEKKVTFLADIAAQINDAVVATDTEGRIIYVNKAFEEMFGYELAEIASEVPFLLDADDTKRQLESFLRAIAEGHGDEFEMRQRHKDGTEFITHLRVSPLQNDEGEIIAWVGILRDITERKRMEETLRQSEEKYRALTENHQGGVFVNQDGRFTYINPAVEKIIGYSSDEFEGLSDQFAVVHPDDRGYVMDQLSRRFEGEKLAEPYEVRVIGRGGEEKRCLISAVLIDYKGKPAVLGNLIDITDRHKAEQRVRESEEMFRLIGENSGDGVVLVQEGRLIYANPEVTRMSGYTEEDFLSGRIKLNNFFSEDVVGMIKERVEKRSRGEELPTGYVIDLIRSDGARRNIEVKVVNFIWKGKFTTLVTGRDITERKLMEEQMLSAQKAESVQRLAGGIAHDFNNLLVGILGNVTLLKSFTGDDERISKVLDQMEAASRQATGLTGQLLAYARGGRYLPSPLDMPSVVKEMMSLIKATVGDAVKVETDFPGEQLPAIAADRSQLEQVVMNLALNGAEAMSYRGKLTLKVDAVENDEGKWVRLHVEDTGPGLAQDVLEHIFDPFFSTKDTGRGMGMAVVYGIVQNHGGYIEMGNVPHGGAYFILSFPALEITATGLLAEQPEESAGKGETVLIVDDEAVVRDVAKSILEGRGYRVLTASSGEEAFDLLRKGIDIKLLLLDIVMPEMDGIEIAKEIRRDYPGVKVLFTSGFSKPLEESKRDYGDGFIQKPFSARELRAKVRDVLEGRGKDARV